MLTFLPSSSGEDVASSEGFLAILPAVSVGNVGQLAVDLLLANLRATRVGSLDHPALLPVVGADPIDEKSGDLMTACQVFRDEERRLLILQLRAGLVQGRRDEFLTDLLDWLHSDKKVGEIVVLSSSNAVERTDSQLEGSQLRYLTSAEDEEEFKKLSWIRLEKRSRFPSLELGKEVSTEDWLFVPGGGFSKKLYLKASEIGVPVTLLLTFCSEGENTQDAIQLFAYFNAWKKWVSLEEDSRLKIPVSWTHLFGNRVPITMY